jgi:GNAT superfamily N-acetyltransferase
MEIQVGCDFNEFKQYYETLWGNLGNTEEYWVKCNPSHLIVLKEHNKIIGDIIWHESNTEEHKPGDPRGEEDRKILLRLLGGLKEFVELHEVWLRKEHRGKGYGKELFIFFEQYMREQGFKTVVYYAYNPAAIAICRKRGYDEACCLEIEGIEGKREKMHVFYMAL